MEDNNKQIILGKLHELIGEKFGNYSRYVIQDRALPNINDGLKPVQRRILYAMYKLKLTQKNSYKKSARVVGDVIGKYHPHGDTSVYEAMVRMSQTWKMSLPLVDMQGNNGSIDGDSAAAMRYTEARMHEITNYLIGDIDKEIVDFIPNFDDTEKEPVVLPSLFPNLIINGATGIASGYSTNIPPHNFNEVLNGLIYVLKNEEINIKELNKIIKGPDFPTGGIIEGKKDILKAYKGGQGKIIIKSKINYDSSRNALIVSEIPFEVNKSNLIKKIDELINSASISTISEVIDETDKTGLQIAILLKKDSNYNSALSFLYQKTDLLKSYSFNMIAIHNRSPQLFSLIEFLKTFSHFIYHNHLKLFTFELNKVNLRLEIIEGIVKAIAIIDEIIAIIRKSNNKSQAREALIKRYKFSENQAEAILNLRLYRLSSTDIIEFEKEKEELLMLQKHYQKGLKNKAYLIDYIVSKLEEINTNFVFPRRTKILSSNSEQTRTFDVKDLLKEEKVRIILTKKNLIKVLNEQEKIKNPKIALDDMVLFDQEVSNFKSLFLFTNYGKYYSTEIFKLPLSKSKENSKNLNDIFSFAPDEKIISIMFGSSDQISHTTNKLVISTKYSYIKAIKYDLSLSTSKNGIKIIKLNSNDFVVSYNNIYDDNGLINVVTNSGFILRYPINSIPLSSFGAQGVINIKLDENDYVIGVVEQDSNSIMKNNKNIIIVSQDGKLKKIPLKFIRETTRTRKGQKISPEKDLNLIKIFESEDNNFENLFYLTQSYTQGNLAKKEIKVSKSTTSKIWFELKDNLIDVSDNSYLKLVKKINPKKQSNLSSNQKTNNFFNF